MKTSAKITTTGIFFIICLLVINAGNAFGEDYGAMKGLKSVKGVFDFELGNPQSALVHLQVIDMTYNDKAMQKMGKKPNVAVVFIGPSVKLVSTDKSGFSPEDQKVIDEIAATISRMAKEGIKFEICLIAVKFMGVDPAKILPEIKQVGNGWISLIAYQSRGYGLVTVK